jgi:putative FmdB family regulatory protein
MPIHEYRCGDCGRQFETLVRNGDPDIECPQCHGRKLARELSVFRAARGGDGREAARSAMESSGVAGGGAGGCCGGACGCRN